MKVLKCDKCGKSLTDKKGFIRIYAERVSAVVVDACTEKYEICKKCYTDTLKNRYNEADDDNYNKWHDLQKEPWDLPKEGGYYHVSGKFKDSERKYWICRFLTLQGMGGWCNDVTNPKVDSWRYMETFEEDNND